MARLVWGDVADRTYEAGVDRGVLYVGGSAGVPWNGITSIDEAITGGEAKPAFLDSVKFRNITTAEWFEATIEAFSAPKEFGPCDGNYELHNGLIATQQPRRAFNLSYRTLIGNTTAGTDFGYKIHLVYNALAGPAQRTNSTLSDSQEAMKSSWTITTLPPSLTGLKPTAHFVIDTRYTPKALVQALEDILYGTETEPPRMPMPSELTSLFSSPGRVVRRNLVTNPEFKTTDISVEVRRNYCVNPVSPSTTIVTSNWLGARGTLSALTDGLRHTISDGVKGAFNQSILQSSADYIPCAAGDNFTVSYYARSNTGSRMGIMIAWFQSDKTTVAATASISPYSTVNDTSFTRISHSVVAPANAAYFRTSLGAENLNGEAATGEWMDFQSILIEKTSVLMPYFDGNNAAADGLTYKWLGTVGNSASTSNGFRPNRISPSANVKVWRGEDGASARVWRMWGTSGLVQINPTYATSVVEGDILTRSMTIASDVSSTATFGYATAGVSQSGSLSVQTTPSDSRFRIVTAPMQAGATKNYLVFTPSTGPIFTLREHMVEKGDIDAPFFDGDTQDGDGDTYEWEGTPHDSTSVLKNWK